MEEDKSTAPAPDEQPKRGPGRPPGRSIYTEEFVKIALHKLYLNQGNFRKTAREIGVDFKTLRVWHNKKMIDAVDMSKFDQVLMEEKEVPIELKRERYERKALEAKTMILDKIIELAPTFKTLAPLTKALKSVHESTTQLRVLSGAPDKEPPKIDPRQSILGILTNQLNIIGNGQQDDRTGGDSKEPSRYPCR